MKKAIIMLIALISILGTINKVEAQEAKCVYGDFTVAIKDNKITVGHSNNSGYIKIVSNLTVANFTNSSNQLECLNNITYKLDGSGRTATYTISASSHPTVVALDASKSSVVNDEKKPEEQEKILLKCSYSNNFLIKTNKQLKVELANGYTLTSKPNYDEIGSSCPEAIYLTCTTRGGNYCSVSLKNNSSATKYLLDSKVIDPDTDSTDKNGNANQTSGDDKVETNNDFWGNLPVVKCGDVTIPSPVPPITRLIVTLIKIAAPLVLIIVGMLDILKAVMASDEKKLKESQTKFVKRLIPAALIFLVVTIVQLLIGLFADSTSEANSLSRCIDCMISDENKCG